MTDAQASLKADTSPPGVAPAPGCTLVIFGAGGDLTKRLLMPALYNLSKGGMLADEFRVLGVDRADIDTQRWRAGLTETMQSFTRDKSAEFYTPALDETAWGFVLDRMDYHRGDITQAGTYGDLRDALAGKSAIFYLAVASRFFGPIVEQIGQADLFKQEGDAFRRVVIEKPFGADLPSAKKLNDDILAHADESQVYRIDHFIGKEVVQSIMAVRFANGMFEPVWRREYIDSVQITAAETVGVEARGSFYEGTGALRDMVPNHMFTLLCIVAMEPPNSFDAEDVRSEKAKLLRAVQPVPPTDAVRGQYGAGREHGMDVPAYRAEPNVAGDSETETYVALRLEVGNWRWSGVPFYLRTGKRMTGRRTEIAIHYKPAPYRLFQDTPVEATTPNITRITIDPDQGLSTQFDAKVPGPQMRLGRVSSSLRFKDFFDEKPNVGYETLLYDCMTGDPTLFQRADAIEASWAIVQPLLESWSRNEGEVQTYAAGSQGPAAADDLLARDGRRWLPVD